MWVLIAVLACILGVVTLGIGACCGFFPILALVYYAYLGYQGDYFEIPLLTDFMVQQGWLEGSV